MRWIVIRAGVYCPHLWAQLVIPPLHWRWKGGILDSPWCLSVCPSVRPSVGKVSATFRENYWLNSFHPWDLYLWGKSLDPYRFSCSCPHFWPSGGQKLTENRGFHNFRENCQLDSFHPRDLYLWGKSLDPYRFSCSCPHFWPSGGQKLTENRGFRNFSRKLSARFISSLGFILMG